MSKVLIVGGGAAGMFASIFAAKNGNEVHVFEKNEKLGKKLFITGKGRCNVTNACDVDELFQNMVSNEKFMYSSFYGFTNQDVMDFFENAGLRLKTERGNRVFPQSDHSSDVIRTLELEMKRNGVHIHLYSNVEKVVAEDGRFSYLVMADGSKEEGDACIIATGGVSYQTTGSTGDGYRFAEAMGHKITEPAPSLVPMNVREEYIPALMGLSLRNVQATVYDGKKELYSDFGEMLFTHFGVSGPIILSLSKTVAALLKANKTNIDLLIDLKPALTFEKLEARVQRDFEQYSRKQLLNGMKDLLPQRLIPVVLDQAYLDEEKPVNQISKEERKRLVEVLKGLSVSITGTRPLAEAIVTAGGVSIKEIEPKTLRSKLWQGLYFAGEVIDIDGYTGGYNLQAAFSTGYAAGTAAAYQ